MGIQHVIPEFILRLKKNPLKFEMYGGYQYRSFCYVEDAAEMTIKLMENKDANNKIVNVGANNYVQIRSLAKKLFQLMNISPIEIERGAPEGSVEKRKPNLDLLKSLDSFVSNITIDDGLKKTYEWYDKPY